MQTTSITTANSKTWCSAPEGTCITLPGSPKTSYCINSADGTCKYIDWTLAAASTTDFTCTTLGALTCR